jgi:hypothetical protein
MDGSKVWKQTQAQLDGETGDDDLICGRSVAAQTDPGCQNEMEW